MKEPKRISLATFVVTLLVMAAICVVLIYMIVNDKNKDNKEENTNKVSNSAVVNNQNSGNKGVIGTFVDYSKNSEVLFTDENGKKVYGENTLRYSLVNKFKSSYEDASDMFFEGNGPISKYCSKLLQSDSAGIEKINSNYGEDGKIEKYTKEIDFEVAIINEEILASAENKGYDTLSKIVKFQNDNKSGTLFENGTFILNGISIVNGNNESKEQYNNNSRAKSIKITVNDEKVYKFELKDTNEVQLFDLNYIQDNIETPIKVRIEVEEYYQGLNSNDIYISEIGFGVSSTGVGAR